MLKKNDKLELEIVSLGYNGEGIGKVDGMVVFVPFALVGEICYIHILKVTKTKAYAKLIKVIKHSPDRVEPICPYFRKCGGCQLQHMSYAKTIDFKTKCVQDNIKNIAKLNVTVNTTIPCDREYEYRNKISLPINKETRKVGLYASSTHRVVDIEDCAIQESWAKDIISVCNKFIELSKISIYDELTGKGDLRHFVARYNNNCLLLTIVINSDKFQHGDLIDDLVSSRFDKYGINFNINKSLSNIILGKDFRYISGLKSIPMQDFGVDYTVTNASFLQVNNDIRDKIYNMVIDNIPKNYIVIDAYSGTGLMSAMLSKKSKKVYGIEIIPDAVKTANKLALDNNINNMTTICGDCVEELPKLISKIKDSVALVLDPPRKGCDRNVISAIAKSLPDKIVYVSCDHATLSRDLFNLMFDTQNGYEVDIIQPFDMFPQTKHVETVVVLSKKN